MEINVKKVVFFMKPVLMDIINCDGNKAKKWFQQCNKIITKQ